MSANGRFFDTAGAMPFKFDRFYQQSKARTKVRGVPKAWRKSHVAPNRPQAKASLCFPRLKDVLEVSLHGVEVVVQFFLFQFDNGTIDSVLYMFRKLMFLLPGCLFAELPCEVNADLHDPFCLVEITKIVSLAKEIAVGLDLLLGVHLAKSLAKLSVGYSDVFIENDIVFGASRVRVTETTSEVDLIYSSTIAVR